MAAVTSTYARALADVVFDQHLDPGKTLQEAQSLYASMGFKPTAAYRFNPVPGTVFLELAL